MATSSTKGIWIDLLCLMWETPERGKITGTHSQLTRLIGTTEDDFDLFLDEARALQFCDITDNVTNCNSGITVINRRIYRDESTRKQTRKRVQKHRDTKKEEHSNADVTSPSSKDSTSSSTSTTKPKEQKVRFLDFILLTEEEHLKILDTYEDKDVNKIMEELNVYIGSSGRRYKSHYFTILSWARRNGVLKKGVDPF